MADKLEREGLELAAVGVDQFISDLRRAGVTWDDTAKRFRDAQGQFAKGLDTAGLEKSLSKMATETAAAVQKVQQSLSQVTKGTDDTAFWKSFSAGAGQSLGLNTAIGALTGGTEQLGLAVGSAAVQIGQKLVGALADAARGMAELAAETASLEGVQIGFIANTEAMVAGTNDMLQALQKGSSGLISNRDLMLRFNEASNLVSKGFAERLPDAFGYLQKISMATGRSMDYLFGSLITGVGRVSPLILDNLLIQVKVSEATDRAAQMFGKEADALSKAEQQAALADIVFERLAQNTAGMPDLTNTASAEMARLNATFQNIKDTLGQYLLPAFATLVATVNDIASAFLAAISPGGMLYPILVDLAAGASMWADGVRKAARATLDFAWTLSDNLVGAVSDTADGMFGWGVEIVAQFAQGMVHAAATVLTQAINMISDALAYWFSPGSPPMIAPDMDQWGLDAFNEFLHGMTNADFDILKAVQAPLQKTMEGIDFAALTKGLAESLASGDRASFLQQIADSSAELGPEIARLADLDFQLADATKAVQDAEEQLAAERESASRAQAKVNTETLKYNELLRKGASREVLDAQLEQINMAEKAAAAARERAAAQQDDIDAKKDLVSQLEEEKKQQQGVIDQILKISDALKKQEEEEKKLDKTKAPKVKGGPSEVGEPTIPGLGPLDLGGTIGGAIEQAKKDLAAKFSGIFDPLKDAIKAINVDIGTVADAWDMLKVRFGQAWERMKEKYPALQELEDWFTRMTGGALGFGGPLAKLAHAFDPLLSDAMTAVGDFIDQHLTPIFESLEELGIVVVSKGVELLFDDFGNLWQSITDLGDLIVKTFMPTLAGDGGEKSGLGPLFIWLKDAALFGVAAQFDAIGQAIDKTRAFIEGLIAVIKLMPLDQLRPFIGHSPSPLAAGIMSINQALEQGTATRLGELVSVTMQRGAISPTISPLVRPAYAPAISAPMSVPTDQRVASISIGPNYVSDAIGMDQFAQRVRQVLRREMRG